jgi:hypothetical protein
LIVEVSEFDKEDEEDVPGDHEDNYDDNEPAIKGLTGASIDKEEQVEAKDG